MEGQGLGSQRGKGSRLTRCPTRLKPQCGERVGRPGSSAGGLWAAPLTELHSMLERRTLGIQATGSVPLMMDQQSGTPALNSLAPAELNTCAAAEPNTQVRCKANDSRCAGQQR